jgi:hypothetical protein
VLLRTAVISHLSSNVGISSNSVEAGTLFYFNIVLSRVQWRLYNAGIGLTTGFIGSHTVTHNYSVYTRTASQFTIALAESPYNYN